mgnify:CR=1 FL=1
MDLKATLGLNVLYGTSNGAGVGIGEAPGTYNTLRVGQEQETRKSHPKAGQSLTDYDSSTAMGVGVAGPPGTIYAVGSSVEEEHPNGHNSNSLPEGTTPSSKPHPKPWPTPKPFTPPPRPPTVASKPYTNPWPTLAPLSSSPPTNKPKPPPSPLTNLPAFTLLTTQPPPVGLPGNQGCCSQGTKYKENKA